MKEMLLIAVGLFLSLLLFRFIRGVILGKRISAGSSCSSDNHSDPVLSKLISTATSTGKAREALREIERLAHSQDAASRATYHCAAGNLAVADMKRPSLAVGFYLRALREDPNCIAAIDRLREILLAQKRLKRFERTCWEVLGRLDDDEVGSEMWIKCWSGLASIYAATPKLVRRSDAIRKLLAAIAMDTDSDDINEEMKI